MVSKDFSVVAMSMLVGYTISIRLPGRTRRIGLHRFDVSSPALSHEFRVEADRGAGEGLRDRAARFGGLCMLGKSRHIDTRHRGLAGQVTLRDFEASILRQYRYLRGRIDVIGFESRVSQYERHRHCEATRMGRAEQFLRIPTLAVLEARVERIRAPERAVSEVDLPLPILDASFPTCVCLACRHDSSFAANHTSEMNDHPSWSRAADRRRRSFHVSMIRSVRRRS